MTVRTFLVGSVLAAIISWSAWILIILYLDPMQAGRLGFILFFLALFLAMASGSGLLGYGIRRIISPDRLAAYAVRTALRQGVLFGLFLEILLIFQMMNLYTWWIAVIATIFFLSVEFVFLNFDQVTRDKIAR